MSVGLDRESKGSGQSEICEFDITILVDEQVLGFQVTMHNAVRMAVSGALQDLVGEFLHIGSRQGTTYLAHVLLQVVLTVLEDQVQLVLGIDHLLQSNINLITRRIIYSTMLGCLSPLSREISLIAVLGTPSSSFSSLIFFSATIYTLHD